MTIEQLADMVEERLAHFNINERVFFFEHLKAVYCSYCGMEQPDLLGGCRCQDDS